MPPAIFFHSDAIEGEGKDLVGRRSAGLSFLRGFLDHVPGRTVHALVEDTNAAKAFEATARELGETRRIDVASLRGGSDFTRLGCVFFPGPGYLNAAWLRQHFDPTACSLVGITHTVSTRRVMTGLHTLLSEPIEPWDAIICTSRAVKSVVQTQFDLEVEYYTQRFGAARVPVPQLPVIPLGINAADFGHDPNQRKALRGRFGVSDEAIVIMTMGRLTSVEKANPVPLFVALEEVAQTTGKNIHLWMAGWAARDAEASLHKDGAAQLCPSVTMQIVDGRDKALRKSLWSGADIFTLPVDNIQETFGLVPVEAMAAGLPVVMPNWDGFRDTVVHSETGFLIPTVMPPPGSDVGAQLARRFADGTDGYLQHLSVIQQQTQIDVRAYTDALALLVSDAEMRRTMGRAGKARVAEHFDWAVVIPQYLNLADELAAMRKNANPASPSGGRGRVNPLTVDPFTLYSGYPSHQIGAQTVVTYRSALGVKTLAALDAVNGRDVYKRRLIPDEKLLKLAAIIADKGAIEMAALADLTDMKLDVVYGAVLFLAKYDFVILTVLESN